MALKTVQCVVMSLREMSEVDSPSLANTENLEGWDPMNLVCLEAQTPQMDQRDLIWSVLSLSWGMDV